MQGGKLGFTNNVFLLIIILLGFLFAVYLILQRKEDSTQILYEKIPGSKFHGPDATWWGYNQSKIVRFEDLVFMYVIENLDNSNKTNSSFVIYKKNGNLAWEKGASFPTSRPGNILIDSRGVLHAFVFEPFDVVKNDSWGKLKHYWFPRALQGDTTNYQEETVIDNDGANETVNIRVGTAIGPDNTMAIGFGLAAFSPLYEGHSQHLYFKKPSDQKWSHLVVGENLGHDWFYPFVWVSGNNTFRLLPVQDDFNGSDAPNIYQKIMYFTYSNGIWNKELIADLSASKLAKSRPRLLEQEELYVDQKGTVHILYKEFLDKETRWRATHKHIVKSLTGTLEQNIQMGKEDINWIRLFEVDGDLYYLYVLYDSAYIRKEGKDELINIAIPKDAHGTYPYIATKRGGTKDSEKYIDIILLAADQYDFKKRTNINYYIRIPKTYLANLF